MKKYKSALLAVACVAAPTLAAPIIAQGSAALDAGPTVARTLAIEDAMRQAALQQGAQLTSTQYMSSGALSESTHLSAMPTTGQMTVLSEYAQDDLYHVRIALDEKKEKPHSSTQCAGPTHRALRRKLATSYFAVERPMEASDLDALGSALADELAQRLASFKQVFSVRSLGRLSVLPFPKQAPDPYSGKRNVVELAREYDTQFIVSGRVVSTAVSARSIRPSVAEAINSSPQWSHYRGWFSALTGNMLKMKPSARQFDIELWVYDGLTGALLINDRLGSEAQGDVLVAPAQPFASSAFWNSDYGLAIDQVLKQATTRIVATLSCIPFTTRIVRVGKEGLVYLGVGSVDGLQVGDQLLVYRSLAEDALQTLVSQQALGIPETLLGDLSLIQVQPSLSIAIAKTRMAVEEGDWARFMVHQ